MACKRLAFALAIFIFGVGGDIFVFRSDDGPILVEAEYEDEPAAFGDGLPLEGLRGFVMTGNPKDGCKNLAPQPPVDNFTGKWIVLLARYNCSFEDKIRNAQSAGFDAAIVHNVNSTELERMSAKNAVGIRIPSVFVNNKTGDELEKNYTYNKDTDRPYYIVMNREVPFDINTHLLLPFAVVVGLCLITMIIFMIIKCIKDRRRAQRHRLPNNALKKIPTCRYSKGDPYDTCAICLDDYVEGDKLRVLPCAHAYHCKCIDPWLTKNRRVCPVCKRRVLAAGERGRHSDSGTDSDDSSAPLVASTRAPTTQGGTFDPQRENPFAAAERFVARLQRQYNPRRDRQDRPDRRSRSRPQSDTTNEADPRQDSSDVSQCDNRPGERQTLPGGGAVDPFLSGILNLRTNHFARENGEDTEQLLSAQSSLPARGCETHQEQERRSRRARRAHRRSNSASSSQHNVAINSTRGEIGVAALPNTNLSSGNDRFVV